jgi:hypothetical protein
MCYNAKDVTPKQHPSARNSISATDLKEDRGLSVCVRGEDKKGKELRGEG